jgi:hypothetical protein
MASLIEDEKVKRLVVTSPMMPQLTPNIKEIGVSAMSWFLGGLAVGITGTIIVVVTLLERSSTQKDGYMAGRKASRRSDSKTIKNDGQQAADNDQADQLQSATENIETLQLFWPRLSVLIVMLVFQSISSIILGGFAAVLEKHTAVIYFLTMLVGVGGNAGGQSSTLVVRDMALGKENVTTFRQAQVGLKLCAFLGAAALLRCVLQKESWQSCVAVALSTMIIVVVATSLGTAIPKLLVYLNVDPGHSSPIVQVIMDVIGVFIVCIVTLAVGFVMAQHGMDAHEDGIFEKKA